MKKSVQLDIYLARLKAKRGTMMHRGAYATVAKELGVSREFVRQRGKRCNFKIVRKREDRICPVCQKLFSPETNTTIFCSRECWTTDAFYRGNRLCVCDVCGLGFLRRHVEVGRSTSKIFYCSRKCFKNSDYLKSIGTMLRRLYGTDYFQRISNKGNKAQGYITGPDT